MKLRTIFAMAPVVAMATLSMNGGVVQLNCSPDMIVDGEVKASLYYWPDTLNKEPYGCRFDPMTGEYVFTVKNDCDLMLKVVKADSSAMWIPIKTTAENPELILDSSGNEVVSAERQLVLIVPFRDSATQSIPRDGNMINMTMHSVVDSTLVIRPVCSEREGKYFKLPHKPEQYLINVKVTKLGMGPHGFCAYPSDDYDEAWVSVDLRDLRDDERVRTLPPVYLSKRK